MNTRQNGSLVVVMWQYLAYVYVSIDCWSTNSIDLFTKDIPVKLFCNSSSFRGNAFEIDDICQRSKESGFTWLSAMEGFAGLCFMDRSVTVGETLYRLLLLPGYIDLMRNVKHSCGLLFAQKLRSIPLSLCDCVAGWINLRAISRCDSGDTP